jgi:ring-1,2-phenylacetyl-CoA epoxidase subunit PaaD
VPDPEIPVISIVDLGIVRAVRVAGDGACDVTITPTYSGCPAMQVIADAITEACAHGVATVRLHNQLSPAWTTDWMSEAGKAALRGYGIAPPAQQVIDISALRAASAAGRARAAGGICPRAGSAAWPPSRAPRWRPPCLPALRLHPHRVTSQFGSTPCKALYKCLPAASLSTTSSATNDHEQIPSADHRQGAQRNARHHRRHLRRAAELQDSFRFQQAST